MAYSGLAIALASGIKAIGVGDLFAPDSEFPRLPRSVIQHLGKVLDGDVGVFAEGGLAEGTGSDDGIGIGNGEVSQRRDGNVAPLFITQRQTAERSAAADAFDTVFTCLHERTGSRNHRARGVIYSATASKFARIMICKPESLVTGELQPLCMYQLIEEHTVMHHINAGQLIVLLENTIAYRTSQQEHVTS